MAILWTPWLATQSCAQVAPYVAAQLLGAVTGAAIMLSNYALGACCAVQPGTAALSRVPLSAGPV